MVQGATWGVGIIFSYLILFLVFYVQTYGSKRTGAGSDAAASRSPAPPRTVQTRTRSKKD